MKCDQAREWFSHLIEGDLPAAERTQVAEHIDRCPACGERYRRFERGIQSLRELPRHPVPRSFASDLLARPELNDGRQAALARAGDAVLPRPRSWKAVAGSAAALLAVAAGVAVYLEWRVSGVGGQRELLARIEAEHAANVRAVEELRSRHSAEDEDGSAQQERLLAAAAEENGRLARELQAQGEILRNLEAALRAVEAEGRLARNESGGAGGELTALRSELAELASTLRREAGEEAKTQRGNLERLAERVGELAAAGAATPGDARARTALAESGADEEQEPVLLLRENNRPVLRPDWTHSGAAPYLFRLYESRDPEWSPLAFQALDQHFRLRAQGFVAARVQRERKGERQGPIGGILGNRAEPAQAEDEESRLVQYYKEFWVEEQRGVQRASPGPKQAP
ncbi:MAG: zf-HC2 domain-containing protein [Planctomycetes bacterium]|nr:zf-HC2 domain-containing protein [Planctomycetota bacterium]